METRLDESVNIMQNCTLSCLKEILTCQILDRVKSTFRFVRFTTHITRSYIKHTPDIMYSPLCHHWTWSYALWDISRSPKDIRHKDIIIKSFHLLNCEVGSPCIPQILRFRNLRALVNPWVICHVYQTLHPHYIKETATSVVQFTSVVALLQILLTKSPIRHNLAFCQSSWGLLAHFSSLHCSFMTVYKRYMHIKDGYSPWDLTLWLWSLQFDVSMLAFLLTLLAS